MYAPAAFLTIIAIALSASNTLTVAQAKPIHVGLDYHRFLQQKPQVETDLASWLDKYRDTGVLPVTEARSADEVHEERLQRFFLTQQTIETLAVRHPDAVFTTDSPFTLLTNAEFETYVQDSYRGAGNTTTVPTLDDIVATVVAPEIDDDDSGDEQGRRLQHNVDWSRSECVQPPRNQGQCGSCWAFATAGAIEAAYCIAKGRAVQLSEQHLTSCAPNNYGCGGGWSSYALDFAKTYGLCLAQDYPYTSGDGQTGQCYSCRSPVTLDIQRVREVPQYDETALLQAVTAQPVAVGVAAGNDVWKQYAGGVVSACPSNRVDHLVVAVGFDDETIKIKNSWGKSWGEHGYMRLRRSGSARGVGTCGVLQDMRYPEIQ